MFGAPAYVEMASVDTLDMTGSQMYDRQKLLDWEILIWGAKSCLLTGNILSNASLLSQAACSALVVDNAQ
jgi:hypothetical protein